jgi:hypothetical protein
MGRPGLIWLRVGICEDLVLYELGEFHTRQVIYILTYNLLFRRFLATIVAVEKQ